MEIHFLELEKIKQVKRRPKDALEAWMMYLNNLEGEGTSQGYKDFDLAQVNRDLKFG